MREIKFRAWQDDKSYNCMVYFGLLNIPTEFNIQFYPIMLYTGLKDKHGKEIYEGDIVEDKFILTIFEPHEKRTEKPFEVKIPDIYYQKEFNGYDFEEDFEIIGNIYENPELLENNNS